jgi:hypothetical protein
MIVKLQSRWRTVAALALGGVLAVLASDAAYSGAWVKTNKGCVVWNSDPKPGETATWTGACADGKVSGKGKLTWKKGSQASTYVGSYKGGKRSGTGTFNDGSGNWYSGPFVDGVPHGTGRCFAKQLGREWKCAWQSGRLLVKPTGDHADR